MTRSEIISHLAVTHPSLTHTDVAMAVQVILDAMSDTLAGGDRIEVRGFGSFALNHRPPRTGRNPKTGDAVSIPAKYVPHFRTGKELRVRVDQ